MPFVARLGMGEQRQRRPRLDRTCLPKGLAPVEAHRAHGVGGGQQADRPGVQMGAGRQLLDPAIGFATVGDQRRAVLDRQPVNLAQA